MKKNTLSRRKFLQAGAAFASLPVFLAACAPAPVAQQSSTTQGETQPDSDVVVLSYWSPISPSGGGGEGMQANVDGFNASQDGIQVELTYVPTSGESQLSEKLITSIAGGNPPNSAYFD